MSKFDFEALLSLTPQELTAAAGKHFTQVFDGDKDKVSEAMAFMIAADLSIGNALRNHLITVVQSNEIDHERAGTIITEFLKRNPPPSDEEAVALMANPEELEGEDSKKAALYLLAQPDLRALFAEVLSALVPDLRVALVTEVLKAPIGSRSTVTIDTQVTDAVTTGGTITLGPDADATITTSANPTE